MLAKQHIREIFLHELADQKFATNPKMHDPISANALQNNFVRSILLAQTHDEESEIIFRTVTVPKKVEGRIIAKTTNQVLLEGGYYIPIYSIISIATIPALVEL